MSEGTNDSNDRTVALINASVVDWTPSVFPELSYDPLAGKL